MSSRDTPSLYTSLRWNLHNIKFTILNFLNNSVAFSTDSSFPQLWFIWECTNFSFIFERSFCQIRIFGLQLFFFQFDYAILPSIFSFVKWVINLIKDFLYMVNYFTLAAFKIPFVLPFDNLITMRLSVDLFAFILLRHYEILWVYKFMSFIKFGRVLATSFSNIFSPLFFFSFLYWALLIHNLVCFLVPH